MWRSYILWPQNKSFLPLSLHCQSIQPYSEKALPPMLRMPVSLGMILALSAVPSRPFRWRTARRTLHIGLRVLGLLRVRNTGPGPWEGGCCWLRSAPRAPESVLAPFYSHPSPWPEPPWGQVVAAAQPPSPGCRGWQPRGHAAQLRASPPQFIPSRYTVAAFYLDHFSVLWYFSCFSRPHPHPLLSPMAGFLRRLIFGESSEHICSLAAAFQEGPVRGSGLEEPGHTGQWRLAGRVQGPWQLRPVVGPLSAAGRAPPQGLWVLAKSWSCSSPARWPCCGGCWLSLLWSAYARLGVREKPQDFENTLAFHLLFCPWF